MKKRFFAFAMSIIMLFTVLSAAMPVSAASKTTTTTTKATTFITKYVVPFDGSYCFVREDPFRTDNNVLKKLRSNKNEYAVYLGDETNKDNETWWHVMLVEGETGFVQAGKAKIVDRKPVASTTTTTSTSKPITTTTTKKSTTTAKATSTTMATTTTTKPTSTTTNTVALTSSGNITYIRKEPKTTSKSIGKVTVKNISKKQYDIVISDKHVTVGGVKWYHIISLNGQKKDGYCLAKAMRTVPAPTTTTVSTKKTTTTAVKPTTTTIKKSITTTAKTTTTTKKTTTTTTSVVSFANCVFLKPHQKYTKEGWPEIINRTDSLIVVRMDPKKNTIELVDIAVG